MKKFCFVTLILLSNCILDENLLQTQFASFKKTYNKKYSDKEEEEKKFKTFKRNLEKYGSINPYSDIADLDQALEEMKLTKKLPSEFSYVNNLGKAKNQENCGFCYVFFFVAIIEAQYSIKFDKTYRFSEQYLLDCSNNALTCNNGDYATLQGYFKGSKYLPLENYYGSFDGETKSDRCQMLSKEEDKYANTKKFKINKFNLDVLTTSSNYIECIKSLLIKYGPIGVLIDSSILKDYKGGNSIIDTYYSSTNLDHAVTIVGYKDYDNNDKTYWIVRNSKGSNWGNSGYFNIRAGNNIAGIETSVFYFDIEWDTWCNEVGCDSCVYYSQDRKLYCESCIYGYRYDSDNKKCIKCSDGCKTCSQYGCSVCKDGYYKSNKNKCYKCHKDCITCVGPKETDCESYLTANINPESYIDDKIKSNCICYGKYLFLPIYLIILSLLY